jgi:predicted amidophosphoribosyltransferase
MPRCPSGKHRMDPSWTECAFCKAEGIPAEVSDKLMRSSAPCLVPQKATRKTITCLKCSHVSPWGTPRCQECGQHFTHDESDVVLPNCPAGKHVMDIAWPICYFCYEEEVKAGVRKNASKIITGTTQTCSNCLMQVSYGAELCEVCGGSVNGKWSHTLQHCQAGHRMHPTWKVCPFCKLDAQRLRGSRLQRLFCPNCSSPDISADATHCQQCGIVFDLSTSLESRTCPTGRHQMDQSWTVCAFCKAEGILDRVSTQTKETTISAPSAPLRNTVLTKSCYKCSHENPISARRCERCGEPFTFIGAIDESRAGLSSDHHSCPSGKHLMDPSWTECAFCKAEGKRTMIQSVVLGNAGTYKYCARCRKPFPASSEKCGQCGLPFDLTPAMVEKYSRLCPAGRHPWGPDSHTCGFCELESVGILINPCPAGKHSWLNPTWTRCALCEDEQSTMELLNSYKGPIQ